MAARRGGRNSSAGWWHGHELRIEDEVSGAKRSKAKQKELGLGLDNEVKNWNWKNNILTHGSSLSLSLYFPFFY